MLILLFLACSTVRCYDDGGLTYDGWCTSPHVRANPEGVTFTCGQPHTVGVTAAVDADRCVIE